MVFIQCIGVATLDREVAVIFAWKKWTACLQYLTWLSFCSSTASMCCWTPFPLTMSILEHVDQSVCAASHGPSVMVMYVTGHGMALHLVAPPPPSRLHGLSILPQGSLTQENCLKLNVTENYSRLREEEPVRVWRCEAGEGQMLLVAVTA